MWGHFLKSESSKGRLVQAEGSLSIEIYHKQAGTGRGAVSRSDSRMGRLAQAKGQDFFKVIDGGCYA